VNIIDSHEVSIDALSGNKDVWSCKWSGSDTVQIFRGDFINNRILYNYLFTLDCDQSMTIETFCEWAAELLQELIKRDYEIYEKEIIK